MRKLIVIQQDSLIVCDNKKCDYKIGYDATLDQVSELFINRPCPVCGQNLLTTEDYLREKKIKKMITWVNKYFSWLTIFIRKDAKY